MKTIYNIKPPVLSADQIEHKAIEMINKYVPYVLEKTQPTPVALMIEKYMGIDLDFMCLSKCADILGVSTFTDGIINVYDDARKFKRKICVRKNTILIDSSLMDGKSTGRCNFTMAHELGHITLHKENCKSMFRCHVEEGKLVSNEDWFEWQANTFASSILMPKHTFVAAFNETLGKREYGNLLMYAPVAEKLANLFQVSVLAATIRIRKLGLIDKNSIFNNAGITYSNYFPKNGILVN